MADDPQPTRSHTPDNATTPAAGRPLPVVQAAVAEPGATTAPASSHPGGALARDRIPGYELLDELGRGGMGVVYRARQLSVNRVVALKVISTGEAARPLELVRFRVEAEAVAALQHPHVVQMFEYGEAGGLCYLALEYVDGGTLAERIRAARFSPREAAALVVRLAGAVHAAHSKGVLHRDLKPANVLLTETGEPKVTDFGLARVGDSDLTQTGAVMGTPSYMSPEQAAGHVRAIGTRSDVWALGAILYELLTVRPPFHRPSVSSVLQAVIHEAPAPPRRLNPKVPRDLETICLKCLRKDPADRYASADALAVDLTAFLGGYPVAARPVGPVRRVWKWVRRHPVRVGLAAAVFLSGLVVGVLMPRYQAVQAVKTVTTPAGVWVGRDKDGEALLKAAGHDARVFIYSGGAVDFWIEHEVQGKAVYRRPLAIPERHSWQRRNLAELGPTVTTCGMFIFERQPRHADGSEDWRIASHRIKRASVRTGGSMSPFFSSLELEQQDKESLSSTHMTMFVGVPVWPPTADRQSSWFEVGVKKDTIPTDRAVCVWEAVGGAGGVPEDDPTYRHFRIRVMAEVRNDTPKD